MTTEAEIKHRCQVMVDMFESDAFQYFEAELMLENVKVTKKGEAAVVEGKTEAAAYAMAELVALNKFYTVREGIRTRHQSFLEAEREQRDDKERTNA